MAETRETQVLEDVVESTEIENPRTTEEAILAQVIAGEEVTINARTRLQTYLSQLTSGGTSEIIYSDWVTIENNNSVESLIETIRSNYSDCAIFIEVDPTESGYSSVKDYLYYCVGLNRKISTDDSVFAFWMTTYPISYSEGNPSGGGATSFRYNKTTYWVSNITSAFLSAFGHSPKLRAGCVKVK